MEGEAVSWEVSWEASSLGALGAALRQAGIPREVFSEAAVISEEEARQETGDEGAAREPGCGAPGVDSRAATG